MQDAFAEKLVRAVERLRVGNGWRRVEIGPLINRQALEDVDKLVQDSVTAGAELVLGGRPHSLGGLFYQPTVLKNVTNTMPVAAREIFGPVAPLITFDTEAEGIALANDTRAGLAAYFYARDMSRASGGWPRGWSTAWWASTRGSSPTPPRSAGSRNPARGGGSRHGMGVPADRTTLRHPGQRPGRHQPGPESAELLNDRHNGH